MGTHSFRHIRSGLPRARRGVPIQELLLLDRAGDHFRYGEADHPSRGNYAWYLAVPVPHQDRGHCVPLRTASLIASRVARQRPGDAPLNFSALFYLKLKK